jgi:hypothetical protein
VSDVFDEREERMMFDQLGTALPRVAPPDDLFDRILDQVRDEAVVVPLRPRRRPVWIAAAAAAVAADLAVAVVVQSGGGLGDPDARAALSPPGASTVVGTAELFSDAKQVRVSLASVPAAPAGHHYEVWVLPEGSDAMISLATFQGDGADVDLDLDLPSSGPFVAVDVSVEEDDGPAAHGDTSFATGLFS